MARLFGDDASYHNDPLNRACAHLISLAIGPHYIFEEDVDALVRCY